MASGRRYGRYGKPTVASRKPADSQGATASEKNACAEGSRCSNPQVGPGSGRKPRGSWSTSTEGSPTKRRRAQRARAGFELDAENAARRTGRRLEDTAVAAAEIHEPVGRTDSQRLEHRGDPPGRQPAPRSQHRGQTKTGNGGETRNNEARRREARNRGGQGSGRPARGQHKPNASARTSQTEPARSSGEKPGANRIREHADDYGTARASRTLTSTRGLDPAQNGTREAGMGGDLRTLRAAGEPCHASQRRRGGTPTAPHRVPAESRSGPAPHAVVAGRQTLI